MTSRDSLSPRPNEWIIHAPVAKTTDELCVQFREAIDYGLLHAGLRVLSPSGSVVAGRWISGVEETSACFAPESNWAEGNYSLDVETRIEDLAGNNINRAFEVDASSPATTTDTRAVITITFAINLSPSEAPKL